MSHRCDFGKSVLFMVLTGLLLAGCSSMGAGPAIHLPPSTPSQVLLADVPFYAQEKYQCGPAALAMALQWSGVDTTPDQIADSVFTPKRKGSFQSDMISATRRYGRLAYPIKGPECLFREIAAGTPVVVLQNLGLSWIPRWHYATVIGFDMDQPSVFLHTADRSTHRIGLRTFLSTWNRADQWGLLIVPPDRMPQCAQETAYLKSAYGLHIAGYSNEAIIAYQQAVSAWPRSTAPLIALGNAYYRNGAHQEAIYAYSQAVEIEPRNGDALNNLAHLLADSGDVKKALAMADRAVEAGGPHLKIYMKTLEEIRQKQN